MEHLTELVDDQIQESDKAQTIDEYASEADRMDEIYSYLRKLEDKLSSLLDAGDVEDIFCAASLDFEDLCLKLRVQQALCEKQETHLIACMEELEDVLEDEAKYGDHEQQVEDQYRSGKL